MDSAATPTKPKRTSRAKKALDDLMGVVPAAPMSHRERMAAVDARAAETRKRVQAEYEAEGYGPMPRTSYRWMKPRTKGLPFSRHVLVRAVPGFSGTRGALVIRHPTKGSVKHKTASVELLQVFMPSLPPAFAASMLGVN